MPAHPRRLSNVSFTPIGIVVTQSEKTQREKEVAEHGLGVISAAIFLAGEMAGSGVLAIPFAMVGTSWAGIALITIFCMNAAFSGTRLGLCWVMLEERYEEFRREIRDPYPSIGDKAVGRWGRVLCTFCICCTLYGAGCVFIVLIGQCLDSLFSEAGIHPFGDHNPLCAWMPIVAACLIPLTWLGTPKDFWQIAVGALVTTIAACVGIIIQGLIDYHNPNLENEHFDNTNVQYPGPTVWGSIKAFASIMFAFAGASTFPTIQADMKKKEHFKISAYVACIILFLIYCPMGALPYFSYGDQAQANIIQVISNGAIKTFVNIMVLLHLVAAFPILTNPPAQYFEGLLNIPSAFGWKRCLFRTISVCILLLIAETVPSFGSILDLVGASTVTMLTFVCPPFFYMKLCDQSKNNKEWIQREIPTWERAYCWILMLTGLLGGIAATYISVVNIVSTEFTYPCWWPDAPKMTISASH